MGFFSSLFGRSSPPASRASNDSQLARPSSMLATHTGFASSGLAPAAPDAARQQFSNRRDLLRMALRDVTTQCGIPSVWLEIRVLAASSSSRKQQGVQARIVVKHWQPLLMAHAPALERRVIQRLMALDPLADQWLLGLCWQLEVPDEVGMLPLPTAVEWTTNRPMRNARPLRAASVPQPSGDVIAGPVRLATAGAQDARASLDRMLAAGDDRMRGHTAEPTQPAPL